MFTQTNNGFCDAEHMRLICEIRNRMYVDAFNFILYSRIRFVIQWLSVPEHVSGDILQRWLEHGDDIINNVGKLKIHWHFIIIAGVIKTVSSTSL